MSQKTVKIIVNPAAGAGKTGKLWPRIMGLFQKHGLRFEHDITSAPGHAVELARDAAGKGFETVVAVGGDGTINEIVNGLHAAGAVSDVSVGIVSTGTGSDYIRTVGVPRYYEDACSRLVNPASLKVDLGMVDFDDNGRRSQRLFVNFAGMGFDAEIVRRTSQQFKSLGSLPSYFMGAITTLLTLKNYDIEVALDGEKADKRICTVIMNNGRYGGGGMFTAPGASLDDGLFDVLIVHSLGKLELLRALPRIYKGTHLTHPKVAMRKASVIEVRSKNGSVPLQADGELLGCLPARFRILRSVLKLVV